MTGWRVGMEMSAMLWEERGTVVFSFHKWHLISFHERKPFCFNFQKFVLSRWYRCMKSEWELWLWGAMGQHLPLLQMHHWSQNYECGLKGEKKKREVGVRQGKCGESRQEEDTWRVSQSNFLLSSGHKSFCRKCFPGDHLFSMWWLAKSYRDIVQWMSALTVAHALFWGPIVYFESMMGPR